MGSGVDLLRFLRINAYPTPTKHKSAPMSDVMNTGPYEERSPSAVMKLRDMLEEVNDGCMLGRREG
jgi:hypothetical protein